MRKDKNITPSVTDKLQQLGYNLSDWDDSQTNKKLDQNILFVLNTASKNKNNQPGYPDRIYFNKKTNLLILVEEKTNIKDHYDADIKKGAISGIKWYLSKFLNNSLFDNYKILGIAVSGDLSTQNSYYFDCFKIANNEILHQKQINNFVSEEKFLSLFYDFDEEVAIANITKSSKKINKLLRNLDSQQRPVILSMLMISLYKPKNYLNNFPITYKYAQQGIDILNSLFYTIQAILESQGISKEKIEIFKTYIQTYKQIKELSQTNILIKILEEIEHNIIPLFNNQFASKSNYDIIGRFYEEFLKYAGVSNVKKGIVLTPKHITTLFTKLVDIKANDVIMDLCCGTGAFLIAAMNKLIDLIENSNIPDKEAKINNIKENQLLGFEINPTMFICSISNMLFRGDGKSRIYNIDSINDKKSDQIIAQVKPTIGFINPPYSGEESSSNPTPKEITFLTKMLDNCSRYGIIIAPLSMYFKDPHRRQMILNKHTLKYVINMPSDLFKPNASTYTAIAVFQTHLPHDYKKDVKFYNFDDGLVVTAKGRIDLFDKYAENEAKLLDFLFNNNFDTSKAISVSIKPDSEWNVHSHLKTNYSNLTKFSFEKTIKEFLIFQIKKEMDIVEKEISDFDLIWYISKSQKFDKLLNYLKNNPKDEKIDISSWKEFNIKEVFDNLYKLEKGRLKTTHQLIKGDDIYYVAAKKTNNGVLEKVEYDEELVTKGNCIGFITGGDGSGGYSLYHPDDFIANSFITIGRSKHLNIYTAMFLITILDQHRYKFSYGRTWQSKRFDQTLLLLPQTTDGKIDWEYIQSFIEGMKISELL
ncbi:N-6 DNA methylase [Mycoplasma sp. 394]